MSHVCRPLGRLSYWVLAVLLFPIMLQATPATTNVSGVIYRADGSPAGGVLLISWSAFTTMDGAAVGAGTQSVTLGTGGDVSVNLIPNVGANPASSLYTVVFQLDDGAVKTEYWLVGTTTPTTVAAVRTTLGATSSASQMATRQYVDAAVAGKASDTTVVHVSGAETIAGTKQFSVAPTVPAPIQPGDAVNKSYVDTALATVGAGSYVSKSGDTMTGPLMLNGDPTAPNHASTRHYVDAGLAGKADVVNGVVPAGELGGGTADGTKCLLGNNTWGPCGGSSNAVSIQNVPVASQAPTDGQVITYESSSGSYKPKAGSGLSSGMQAVKYATDFIWTQFPSTDLSTAGAKTLNLASCPAGVRGGEPEYWLYISGTGAAEAVKVSGGTCNGDGQPGTLQFTTANSHGGGYSVGSASGGLQEAVIAARWIPSGSSQSQGGRVVAPPGDFNAYARVSVRSNGMTVDFSGSIINCYMSDTCVFLGDPASSVSFMDITIVNPRGRPMVVNGTYPFIETNAQKTRLFNVETRLAPTGAYFGTYVQVDDDQAFLLDGLDTGLGGGSGNYGVRCDATVCSAVVTAPGPFNVWSAVGWLKNLNISMQGHGNGVDWQSGNTIRISDSVIQGYSQYGVRCGTRRGGYGDCELENVYEETGANANPLGNLGAAGVIVQGNNVRIHGGEAPNGGFPSFANTGTNDYRYYIVAHHTTYGSSNPLYLGSALSNGSGSISVLMPDIAGAAAFDLLRVPGPSGGSREQGPFGTGNFGVAVGVTRATACSNGVCTFTDTNAALAAYTVLASNNPYMPMLNLWPGNLVLGSNQDSSSVTVGARAFLDTMINGVVAETGSLIPGVEAQTCAAVNSWTPMLVTCVGAGSPYSYVYDQPATMLVSKPNADGGGKTNLKGRLNFLSLGTAPGHVITLSDSNPQKTIATAGNRPLNDVSDAYIGLDQGDGGVTNVGISVGAPKSISNYIGNAGDGSNWLERLTSSAKTFKTNVTVQGNLTVTGTCTGCGGGGSITLKTNGVTNGSQSILNLKAGSNVTLTDDGSGGITIASSGGSGGSVTSVFGRTGVIAAQTSDYTVAQVTGAETVTNKGLANGYASLDATGKVPSSQLPSSSGLTWPLQAAQDGTSSAPVYSFANESTLGFYRFGSGQIGLAGDLRFNRLFSSSSNAPQTGVSIGFGATDAMSAYYSSSDETCGSTPCVRLIRKRSGTGEAELGTHYGVYISGPLTSSVGTGSSPFVVASSTLVSNLNSDMVDSASASVTPAVSTIPIADGTGKIASGWLPAISESGVTNLTTDMAGMEKTGNKGTANGYASLDGSGKLANTQMPALTESQITGLSGDLAAKLGSSGPQTFSGDLTVSGAVYANAFQSTGSGPWSVEGAYGALTAAGTSKSKLGFGANGKLSVSENSGAVTEVAKKLPQQFTYTFFDPNNPLTMSLQVPSVYVNRATAVHVVEVYCEIDTGAATINLQNGGANILSADLACSTSGAVSTSFVSGKDAIAVTAKINHITTTVGSGLHRLNVVVKYTVD